MFHDHLSEIGYEVGDKSFDSFSRDAKSAIPVLP